MTRMFALACLATTIATTAGATTARAEEPGPCACEPRGPSGQGMPLGPVQAALLDGELGSPRHACPRHELAVGANGLALVDFDHFYGHVRLSGMIWGSAALDPRTELFLTLEALRYETVISSVDAESLGVGHVSFGITRALVGVDDWVLSVSSRLALLPASNDLYANAWPIALDAMALFEIDVAPWLRAHAHVGTLASLAISAGPDAPRAAALFGGGAAWRPVSWFALVVDLDMSLGRTATLDHLALAPALRFAIARFALELSGTLPLAGQDRTLAAATLRLSHTF